MASDPFTVGSLFYINPDAIVLLVLLLWSEVAVLLVLAGFGTPAYRVKSKHSHMLLCLLVALAGAIFLHPFLVLPWFLARHARSGREVMYRLVASLGFLLACFLATGWEFWMACLRWRAQLFGEGGELVVGVGLAYLLMLLFWAWGGRRERAKSQRRASFQRMDAAHE